MWEQQYAMGGGQKKVEGSGNL